MVNQTLWWNDWCRKLMATDKEPKMNYCTHDDGRTLVTRDGLGKCPLCVALEDIGNLRARIKQLSEYLHVTTDENGEHHRDWVADCQDMEARIKNLEAQLNEYSGWAPDQFLRYQQEHKKLQKSFVELDAENDRKRRELIHAYRKIKELEKWPAEMAKVNGLGDKQTPEECGGFVVDLTNSFVEIKTENTRLSAEWQQVHDWNNELVGQHYKLESKIRQLKSALVEECRKSDCPCFCGVHARRV